MIYNSATDWPCSLCLPGDSAVWPSAQRATETVSAALPVLQPSTPHQSALPLPHFGLLQQPPEQGHLAAGDELCAAGYIHSGKCGPIVTHMVDRCTRSVHLKTLHRRNKQFGE